MKNSDQKHFVHIFVTLADRLSSCSFINCVQKMLAHYTDTGMEIRSLFVDWIVSNALLQINPDLNSPHCCNTVKLCN